MPMARDVAVDAPAAVSRRLNLKGRTLREHTARGSLINGAFLIGLTFLGFIKGFVLAGLLTAEDYGIWGILVISLGTLVWLRQIGIGDKYIQQDDEDQELAFHKAFTLEAMFTGVFMVLVAGAVPLVALVYGLPELVLPGIVLLLILPASIFQSTLWVHYRRMDFLRQRTLQAVDPIVGIVVSIALAIAGVGYWALILGVVAGAWAGAVVAVWYSPYRLRLRYSKGTFRSYADFSWPLAVAGGASLVIAQGSVLIGEAELGLAGAGAIALAATIAQFAERVDGIVTGALYPAICAVRDRTELLAESFVKSNRLALIWAMPFGIALTLFSADLVEFGIGEQWREAVPLLEVFGLCAAFGHLGYNWHAYFRARDRTRPMAVAAAAAMVIFLATAIPLTAAYGLEGFAIAIAAQTVAHVACRAYYLRDMFEGLDVLRHAARAIAPTIPAVAVVLLARAAESGERTLGLAVAELAAFSVVVVACTVVMERMLLREVLRYVRARPVLAP